MSIKQRFQKSLEPTQGQINKFIESSRSGNLKNVTAFLDKYGDKYANARFNGDGGSALGLAIFGRQPEIAKELIRRGADYNQRLNGLGQETLLMQATADNAPEMAQILVDAGADQAAVNSQGRSAKDIAHRRHYLDVIKVLDPAFDTSKAPDHITVDAYVAAAGNGDVAGVRKFLGQYGAGYVDALSSTAATALKSAIAARQPDVIRELHTAGADMNVKDPGFNFSMAYWALSTRDPAIVKLVIRLGADFDAETLKSAKLSKCDQFVQEELDKRDYRRARVADPSLPYPKPTAEEIEDFVGAAGKGEKKAITDFLAEFGPEQVNIQTRYGASAVRGAVQRGGSDTLALLETLGGKIGPAELEEAVSAGNKVMVKELLGRGIPVTEDALKFAVLQHEDAGMVVFLLDNGIKVDAPVIGPATMLHLAAFTGKELIVKELIDRKANTGIRTEAGDTAAQLALHAGHKNISQMIETAENGNKSGAKPAAPAAKLP